jgi:hypothetical protein
MRNVFKPPPKPELTEGGASVSTLPAAWQPFTFRGVAAFAFTSYNRLFWIQVFFAAVCATATVWALSHAWTPVIRSAVRNLPDEAPARAEQLIYPASAEPVLAETRHLAILLKVEEGGAAASDVRIEFRPSSLRVCSLFGCLVRSYAKKQTIYLTRQEANPWWDAWEPILLGIVAVVTALFFLGTWTLLATVVFLFIRLYAYFADRQITMGGSWRLSAAAFLPGSLALILALVLYALGIADLIRFLLAIPGHLLIALLFLALAPRKLDHIPTVLPPSVNPFTEAGGHDKISAQV